MYCSDQVASCYRKVISVADLSAVEVTCGRSCSCEKMAVAVTQALAWAFALLACCRSCRSCKHAPRRSSIENRQPDIAGDARHVFAVTDGMIERGVLGGAEHDDC